MVVGRALLVFVFGLVACSSDAGGSASVYIYVKASNTKTGAHFGTVALSADGSTLAVGAPYEASNATGVNGSQASESAPGAGAVYVYTRAGGTWSQQAYIKASNTDAEDGFGGSLALSADGSTLAVAARGEESNATGIDGDQTDNSATGAGAVYVYTRAGGTWSQQAYVKASNTDAGDSFGSSVALSGDGSTLVVGASSERSSATGIDGDQTDNSATGAGAVYVYTRAGATWSQQAYLKASNTAVPLPGDVGAVFGVSVALSSDGSTLAVGAQNEGSSATGIDGDQADISLSGAGAVFVFRREGTTWSQQAYVKASNTSALDDFGNCVALSSDGSTLVVGAAGEDSSATGVNGDQTNDDAVDWAGAAYVYTRTGTAWSQQAYVKASNTDANDWFGGSVALSSDGSTLVVGAYMESSLATGVNGDQTNNGHWGTGAVYKFKRAGGAWSQEAYLKSSNTDVAHNWAGYGASFGRSVALSSDGSTLAVGAPNDISGATGIGGDENDHSAGDAGAVHVF